MLRTREILNSLVLSSFLAGCSGLQTNNIIPPRPEATSTSVYRPGAEFDDIATYLPGISENSLSRVVVPSVIHKEYVTPEVVLFATTGYEVDTAAISQLLNNTNDFASQEPGFSLESESVGHIYISIGPRENPIDRILIALLPINNLQENTEKDSMMVKLLEDEGILAIVVRPTTLGSAQLDEWNITTLIIHAMCLAASDARVDGAISDQSGLRLVCSDFSLGSALKGMGRGYKDFSEYSYLQLDTRFWDAIIPPLRAVEILTPNL